MKRAGREGISRDEGRRFADRAVRSEVAQIGADFLGALRDYITAPGLPLNGWSPPFDPGRAMTPIEQRCADHAEALTGPDRIERALDVALRERVDASLHNIDVHGAKVDPRGVAPRSRTLREDTDAAVERLRRGEPPLEKTKLNIDETDLTGRRRR